MPLEEDPLLAHETASALADVHEAIARLLPRHPELLEDARAVARRWDVPVARTLPLPWKETSAQREAKSLWRHLVELDADDIAAWIPVFELDLFMNTESPFPVEQPPPLIRREISVLRRRRRGKTHDNTKAESKLARVRIERGLSQEELARLTGLPLSTYWRLERKRISNPPIGYLAVCADALDVPLEELVEPEYLAWRPPAAGDD